MSAYVVKSIAGNAKELDPYRAMIFSKWMRSLRYGNYWIKLTDSKAYFRVYQQLIEAFLNAPGATVKLAVLSDEPDVCLGWSLHDANTGQLHYVYVHKDFRKIHVATSLIPENVKEITHITKLGEILWQRKLPKIPFNPFLM